MNKLIDEINNKQMQLSVNWLKCIGRSKIEKIECINIGILSIR